MVGVRLNRSALAYVVSALADADGVASSIRTGALRDPTVFVPKDYDLAKLHSLDAGGVSTQALADEGLSSHIWELKKSNFRLCSVVFHDPWSQSGDLDYARQPPSEMVTLGGRIYHLFEIADFTSDSIGECRGWAVSFPKIIYVSELSLRSIRELIESGSNDLFQTLAQSVRHIAANAYDDESWIIVNMALQRPEAV